jgi:hypothetical protein
LNLERSISNLSKRIERFDPSNGDDGDGNGNYWKGKRIIPLNQWIELKRTPYAWKYFPDDFNEFRTLLSENEFNTADEKTKIRKWNSDYLELMECRKNPNYGRRKCFDCLLSPDWEEAAIFIGINRLAAKGLVVVGVGEEENDEKSNNNNNSVQYPCPVVNRFQCPYEKDKVSKNANFDVEDLYELEKMVFAVEIGLAVAKKDTSAVQIRNKQELYHALTDRETLHKILQQALDYELADKDTSGEECKQKQDLCEQYRDNKDRIVEYFMKIKDKVEMEELTFY